MAVEVTITSFHRDLDYFQGKNSAIYSYATTPPSSEIGLSLMWALDNRIVTVKDVKTLQGESNLSFTGANLVIGEEEITPLVSGSAWAIVLGDGDRRGDYSRFEYHGRRIAEDEVVGALSWHNYLSEAEDLRIAEIGAYRGSNDNAGYLSFQVANETPTLQQAYKIEYNEHTWLIDGTAELHLTISALHPEADEGTDLGTNDLAFNDIFGYNLRLKDLTGVVTRVGLVEADGDVAVSNNLTFNGSVLTVTGDVIPGTNSTHDIGGNSDQWWANLYVDHIYVNDTDTWIGLDSAGNMIFNDANGGPYELSELATSGGGESSAIAIDSTLCSADSTTNIDIGDTSTDDYFVIHYMAERILEDSSGSVKGRQSGIIYITYNNETDTVYYTSDFAGEELGLEIEADSTSAGDIRLNLIVDDSSANNLTFEGYIVTGFGGAVSETGYWDRTGTTLSPTTAGDDMTIDQVNIADTDTYIAQDSAGNMIFYDVNLGYPVELSELASASASITFGTDNQIPFTNAGGDDFDYSAGLVFSGTALTVDGDLIPGTNSTHSIGGSSSQWWANAYIDKIYVYDTDTYIGQDSAGNLIFEDTNGGPYELSELAAAGAGDVTASGTLTNNYLIVGNGTTSISVADASIDCVVQNLINLKGLKPDSTANVRPIGDATHWWNDVYASEYYMDAIGVRIYQDTGDIQFQDTVNGTVALSSLVAAGGGWSLASNVISPTVSTDDVRLATGNHLEFIDADSYIYGSATDVITVYTGGTQAWSFANTTNQCARNLVPASNKTYELGAAAAYWTNCYVNNIKIYDASQYITGTSTTMTFYSNSALALTLNSDSNVVVSNACIPEITDSIDLGASNLFWQNTYSQRYYIDDTSTYIWNSSGSIAFAVSSTPELVLSSTTLRPSGGGGIDLGDSTNYFGNLYINPSESEEDEILYFREGTNRVYYYAAPSDRRLKENLIPIEDASQKISKITGYSFNFNEKGQEIFGSQSRTRYGLIAQEVQEVLPEAVAKTKHEDYLKVRYEELIPVLVQATKEQQTEIDLLKSELFNLRKEVETLINKFK